MFKVMRSRLPSAMIYIIIFLAISAFVTSQSTKDNKFEMNRLKVCVFDEDDTPESRALTKFIGKHNDIVEIDNNRDTITDSLYYKTVNYALIINKGYAERLAAGETAELFGSYHMDESYSVVYMSKMLDEYTGSVKAYLAMGKSLEEAVSATEAAMSQETEVEMLRVDKGGDSHFSVDFAQYFQFMPYILVSVIISIVSLVLVTMNKKDIRYRTNCSCLKNSKYTFQLFFGSFLFVLFIWLIFMVAGTVFNKEMYTGRAWLAVLNSFIYTLVAGSITVFLSAFVNNMDIINFINQAVSLGMSFMCGVFVRQSLLGDGVLKFAHILPTYWYVGANNLLVGSEVAYSASEVYKCIGV
jgi:ABC-2 type transport system permease protein